MKNLYKIVAFLCFFAQVHAQQKPIEKQIKSVLIMNATAHLGNGKIIENSIIGFKDGKITIVADAATSKIDLSAFDIKIDASKKTYLSWLYCAKFNLGIS